MGYVQRLEQHEEDGHGPYARRKNDTQDPTLVSITQKGRLLPKPGIHVLQKSKGLL